MPVDNMLNSYSGWATCDGYTWEQLLIVTGALVGSSGTSYLTLCAEIVDLSLA